MIEHQPAWMRSAQPVSAEARSFCKEFIRGTAPRYVLGRNGLALSIADAIHIDGFIDQFSHDLAWLGRPVVRDLGEVPAAALVVSAVIGRPLTVRRKLREAGLRQLDYFAFQRDSGLPIAPVRFWPEFQASFPACSSKYEWLYRRLADNESREVLSRLVSFRLSQDLEHMNGFVDAQGRQYFEEFLQLAAEGESFADIGSFDGYTALQFIERCPGYRAVHVFEPEPSNLMTLTRCLGRLPRVKIYPYGLADKPGSARFSAAGSCSCTTETGELSIALRRYDDVVSEEVSFIKMDIEGGEQSALAGAAGSIRRYGPRLAISAYHRAHDLWQIAEQVLAIRDDYRLYLRHYTEGVDETVLFFIPERILA